MKPTPEVLLINALINTHDIFQADALGITPDMFLGFQTEYLWVISYQRQYGGPPSREALLSKFPDFPLTDNEDVTWSADEVRYANSQRSLRKAVHKAASFLSDDEYEQAVMALASYTPLNPPKPLHNALGSFSLLDRYDEKPDALEVPWQTVQKATGGLRPGDLWYLAARPGQGKSWNLAYAAAHALLAGRRVIFYSLEMPEEQVMIRMHVVLGRMLGLEVDHIAMRDRIYDLLAYRKLVNQIRDHVPGELYLHDTSRGKVSPASIVHEARNSDLVIIDYATLMVSPLGKRAVDDWRFAAAISNELKEVALTCHTRLLVASQINRDGDNYSKYPPKLKNLAQSDSMGQDGDVIITHKKMSKTTNIYSLEKNRHGESGLYFYARFLPNEGGFDEISKERAEEIKEREDGND